MLDEIGQRVVAQPDALFPGQGAQLADRFHAQHVAEVTVEGTGQVGFELCGTDATFQQTLVADTPLGNTKGR